MLLGAVGTLTLLGLGRGELTGFGGSGALPSARGPALAAGRKGRLAPPYPAQPNLRALAGSWDGSWLPFAGFSPASRAPLPARGRARDARCPARWALWSSPRAQDALQRPGPPRSCASPPARTLPALPDASSPPSPWKPYSRSPSPGRPSPPGCPSPPPLPRASGRLPPGLPPRFCPGSAPRRGCPPTRAWGSISGAPSPLR